MAAVSRRKPRRLSYLHGLDTEYGSSATMTFRNLGAGKSGRWTETSDQRIHVTMRARSKTDHYQHWGILNLPA